MSHAYTSMRGDTNVARCYIDACQRMSTTRSTYKFIIEDSTAFHHRYSTSRRNVDMVFTTLRSPCERHFISSKFEPKSSSATRSVFVDAVQGFFGVGAFFPPHYDAYMVGLGRWQDLPNKPQDNSVRFPVNRVSEDGCWRRKPRRKYLIPQG